MEPNRNLGITHITNTLAGYHFDNDVIRTPLGGFINHSESPNCQVREHLGNLYLVTLRDIEAGEELTLRYTLYNPIT